MSGGIWKLSLERYKIILVNIIIAMSIKWRSVRKVEWTKERYDEVFEYLKTGEVPESQDTPSKRSKYKKRFDVFSIKDKKIVLEITDPADVFWNKKDDVELFDVLLPHVLTVVPQPEVKEYLTMLFKSASYNGHRGKLAFHTKLNKNFIGISRLDVENFLKNNEIKQLSKPTEQKVVKPIRSGSCFEMLVIDLIDMSTYEKANKNVTFILTVIDHFSKFAFCRPLKNKTAVLVAAEMQNIIMVHHRLSYLIMVVNLHHWK
jgi:hypothetical protein